MHRQKKTVEKTDDIVIGCCGDEGSGKSTFSQALGGIDPNFHRNYIDDQQQIYFLWKHYVEANKAAIRNRIDEIKADCPPKIFNKLMSKYDLEAEDLQQQTDKNIDLQPGSVMLYDEAGTQMFNRAAMTQKNIDQVLLYISNRFLRIIHILNVPKPRSLDLYVREERLKYFIYIDKQYSQDLENVERVAYIWGKAAYKRMLYTPYWWTLLGGNFKQLLVKCPPDFRIEIPNLVGENTPTLEYRIPSEAKRIYDAEKAMFNLKQSLDMSETKEEDNGKQTIEQMLMELPKQGEDYQDYCKRTGKGKSTFYERKKMLTRHKLYSIPNATPS